MVAAGMVAAEAEGGVDVADPEATIDGAEPRQDPARSLPVEVLAVVRDYPELLEVDRRHYAVVRELARGGMGRVLEARDLRLGRQVAIKELLPKNRDIARRFEREARITARLQHPSIIHVYEAGVWQGGEPFYAMPVVPGQSLDKLVAEKHTLAERLALLPRVIAVADALAYAHDKNVIHRDLKPANVLVGEFGETVVIDWGLAKDLGAQGDPKESMKLSLRATGAETASGSVVGTPAYMPPEQARGGDAVDHRADVYALGALLYKVLAGHAPYQGATADEVNAQVKAGPPTPLGEREPETPPDLLAIVRKAMAREPDDRYATASQLAKDLERFQTGQLVGAHRYTAGQLVRRWLRRHRLALGVAVAAAATLAIVGAVSVRNVVDARDRAERRRSALLEEQGRGELLAGHAGAALAFLVGSLHDGANDRARGFMLAEAMRPFQAETRMLTHEGGRVVVAASPDGKHIATATRSTVELWTAAGDHQRVLGKRTGSVVMAFDATSTHVAVGCDDGVVEVWAVGGTHVASLRADTHAVVDLAFSPDGRLATVGADGLAKVWTLATATDVESKCKATSPLLSVRFDAAGWRAAAGAEDGEVCVWDTFTGDVTARLRGHAGPVTAVRWSPDATWIATASEDGTARVWSASFAKQIVAPLVHGRPVEAAELSADGELLVTGDDEGAVRMWRIPAHLPTGYDATMFTASGGAKLSGGTGRIRAIAFSADGELVATAGDDRLANLWETHGGQPVARFEQALPLTSVAFAADRVVTGGSDGTSRVWDPAAIAVRPRIFESAVHALAVSSRDVVAVARDDSYVELVAPEDAILEGHLGSVRTAAFTPDGATLITAGDDAHPIAWDIAAKRPLASFPDAPQSAPFRALVVAPDGTAFATAGRNDVIVWSLATHTMSQRDTRGAKIRALAYSPAGDVLVGADGEGTLIVWNRAGEIVATQALKMSVTALAFSPDGTRLAVGGGEEAQIYRFGRASMAPVTRVEGTPGELQAMVFACGGACLITGGETGIAQIWDAAKGTLLGTRDPHAGAITGLALAEHGTKLWIATEDKTVGEWDVRVETRNAVALECFMSAHVPWWRLGANDVAIRTEGEPDDQHRSDCK
jgi:WD40 repeat protein